MNRLEKAIWQLERLEQVSATASPVHRMDGRWKLLLALTFLCGVLSLPLHQTQMFLLALLLPAVVAFGAHVNYRRLFCLSLWALPFAGMVALFSPMREVAGILLRAVLSLQTILLLIETTGFRPLCNALERLKVPRLLTSQLLLIYRYLSLLLTEMLTMHRAVMARGYGRRRLSVRLWTILAGQLLLRSLDRATRVHQAMLARGEDFTVCKQSSF